MRNNNYLSLIYFFLKFLTMKFYFEINQTQIIIILNCKGPLNNLTQ